MRSGFETLQTKA